MRLFGPRANRHIFRDFLSLIGSYDTGKVLVDAAERGFGILSYRPARGESCGKGEAPVLGLTPQAG